MKRGVTIYNPRADQPEHTDKTFGKHVRIEFEKKRN